MKTIKKILIKIIIILLIIIAIIIGYGYNFYKNTIAQLPIDKKVSEIRENSKFVKKEDLPDYYLNAIVAVEDRRFYTHGAADLIGIARAIYTNIKTKGLQEGGSTITQQVAKNMYFTEEKNGAKRKIAEIFIAADLEKMYSKKEILEMYVNIIYFGNGYYGVKDASNGYLKKEPKEMNISEATMMAGIPNAPSVYAPTVNKELCKQRQKKVISSMVENNYISEEEAKKIDSSFIDNIN